MPRLMPCHSLPLGEGLVPLVHLDAGWPSAITDVDVKPGDVLTSPQRRRSLKPCGDQDVEKVSVSGMFTSKIAT